MNKKWNEMTPAEKIKLIAICIYVVIALVFVVLDLAGVWKNDVCAYMLAAFFLVEGVVSWKKNRNVAITELILSVVMVLGTF